MRIYISGPISHYNMDVQQANLEKFHEAEAQLRAAGHDNIFNPAANDKNLPADASYADYMRADIAHLLECDGLAMLPGSGMSQGAMIEFRIARVLNLKIRTLHEWIEGDQK